MVALERFLPSLQSGSLTSVLSLITPGQRSAVSASANIHQPSQQSPLVLVAGIGMLARLPGCLWWGLPCSCSPPGSAAAAGSASGSRGPAGLRAPLVCLHSPRASRTADARAWSSPAGQCNATTTQWGNVWHCPGSPGTPAHPPSPACSASQLPSWRSPGRPTSGRRSQSWRLVDSDPSADIPPLYPRSAPFRSSSKRISGRGQKK